MKNYNDRLFKFKETKEINTEYKREYKSLISIKDNYPKYILSTEWKIAGEGENGIFRMNIIDFLLTL